MTIIRDIRKATQVLRQKWHVFRYLEREPDAPDPGGAAEG